MPKDELQLGEFEQYVLLAVLSLGKGAYGASIRQQLHEAIARDVSLGALYATIERLEKRGLVTSNLDGATAKRGGKAKRMIKVTAVGRKALQRSRQQLTTMWDLAQLRSIVYV